MTLRTLNPLLWARGWALPNLGDIDAQTVAGAIATGTHGTGARHRGLADQVRALELVTADGAVRTCSPSENAEVFAAARVGLGALGVLVSVTLQTVPAFRLHAVEAARPLEGALDTVRRRRRPRRVLLVPAHRRRRHQAQQPHRRRRGRRAGGWPSGWATS